MDHRERTSRLRRIAEAYGQEYARLIASEARGGMPYVPGRGRVNPVLVAEIAVRFAVDARTVRRAIDRYQTDTGFGRFHSPTRCR